MAAQADGETPCLRGDWTRPGNLHHHLSKSLRNQSHKQRLPAMLPVVRSMIGGRAWTNSLSCSTAVIRVQKFHKNTPGQRFGPSKSETFRWTSGPPSTKVHNTASHWTKTKRPCPITRATQNHSMRTCQESLTSTARTRSLTWPPPVGALSTWNLRPRNSTSRQ